MKRKPNKPEQEPRERPGSWEEPADPGGASSGDAGGGSPGGAGTEGTSGQSVHKSKFRQKSKQEQAAASKLRMEKRVEKLEKYFHRDDASAFVTFTVEKDKLCTVEITIRDGSTLLRAQTTEPDGDMRGAIDAAVSYIERQILKNKTRLAKRLRSDAFPAVPMDDFSVAEESEFHIVRTKRFSVKPMSPEEAILQMNLLDHSFFVFRSSEDDGLSIVYRRKNGGYGLIVTDEEE